MLQDSFEKRLIGFASSLKIVLARVCVCVSCFFRTRKVSVDFHWATRHVNFCKLLRGLDFESLVGPGCRIDEDIEKSFRECLTRNH